MDKEARRRQLLLETDAVTDGVLRVRQSRERLPLAKTSVGQKVLSVTFEPLVEAIRQQQEAVKRGRRWEYGLALLLIDAERQALIVLNQILYSVARTRRRPVTLTALSKQIGRECDAEHYGDIVRDRVPDLVAMLLGRNKNKYHGLRIARDKADRFLKLDWIKTKLDFKLGAALVELAKASTGLIEERHVSGEPATIHLTAKAEGYIRDLLLIQDCFALPRHRPMTVPPNRWERIDKGGYEGFQISLVKHQGNAHILKALETADLGPSCEAVNALQETPWTVHREIHGLVRSVCLGIARPCGRLRPPRIAGEPFCRGGGRRGRRGGPCGAPARRPRRSPRPRGAPTLHRRALPCA